MSLVPEAQTVKVWKHSKHNAQLEVEEQWIQKYYLSLFMG